jgi:hypothetical protein
MQAAIDKARAETEAKGELKIDPKGTYGIICRACTKPNAPNATFCTGCSFPASKWDLQRLPDNIFLEMVNGKDVVLSASASASAPALDRVSSVDPSLYRSIIY